MADQFKIDLPVLQNYIAQYKKTFAEHRSGRHKEIYKWKAVKHFQDHWNLEATDFPAMLKESLSKTKNLLASVNYYPRKVIESLAAAQPEEVRSMFLMLFGESQDVVQRARTFGSKAEKLFKTLPDSENKMTHQDPNAISTYLWLRYPDKYYIYKNSVIKDNAQKLCHLKLPADKFDRMVFCFDLYNAICKELAKDDALIALSQSNLEQDCYPDDELKTLTIDIGYFINQYAIHEVSAATQEIIHNMDKNIILYGPPGTGKTYHAVQYAVSMIEETPFTQIKKEEYTAVFQRYLKYKEDGLIAFTTFHQSFGYEEFIEGIRPVLVAGENSETNNIEYELYDGIFKSFCDKASIPLSDKKEPDLGINKNPAVWKVSLERTGDNPTRKECMDNNHIRIGWDAYGKDITDKISSTENFNGKAVLNTFYNKMKIGDIVMSCYSNQTVDAIGVITGDPEWHEEYDDDYKRLRKVNWLVKGINEDIVEMNGGKVLTLSSVYRLSIPVADVLQILRKTNPSLFAFNVKPQNRIFIIDEINRGNISKIFGELITLLEPSKRIGAHEELKTTLPYSGQSFGIPDNVYVLGTMNTADRSIALIDTALRRRFSFIEMQPDSAVLENVLVDGLNIAEMLDTMNKRITVLLDREHTIGHSYLLPLKDNPTLQMLADIFETKIVPLLQEYFYDDYEKIQLVLGDNQKKDDRTRFIVKNIDTMDLFGGADIDCSDYYELNKNAFMIIEAYTYLCSASTGDTAFSNTHAH